MSAERNFESEVIAMQPGIELVPPMLKDVVCEFIADLHKAEEENVYGATVSQEVCALAVREGEILVLHQVGDNLPQMTVFWEDQTEGEPKIKSRQQELCIEPDYLRSFYFTDEKSASEKNEMRRKESLEITEQGRVVAATNALIDYKYNVSEERCLDEYRRSLNFFNEGSRLHKVFLIYLLSKKCREISNRLNPGCADSHLAKNLRRLELLKQTIKLGLAEGDVAVRTVDLAMGISGFGLGKNGVYMETIGIIRKRGMA